MSAIEQRLRRIIIDSIEIAKVLHRDCWSGDHKCSLCRILSKYYVEKGRPFPKKRLITYNGITDTITGWAKRIGIKQQSLSIRLNKYKWPLERALAPTKKYYRAT